MPLLINNLPSAERQPPLFSIRQLSFTYPDGTPGLQGVTLDIHAGDRIALMGPNGSGKSTLIRHLNGLNTVQEGSCLFEGSNIEPDRNSTLRQRIGLLFQDPDDQLFCPTLYEDVAFGPRNQGKNATQVDHLVRNALAGVNLDHLLYKSSHSLSYGQKKRAALAAILAMEPEVLLLDEPTANLDPGQERRIKELLAGYTGTLIIIEHDLLFLQGICNRAVVLVEGRVQYDQHFDDLLGNPRLLVACGLDFTFRFTDLDCAAASTGHQHCQVALEQDTNGYHRQSDHGRQPLIELQRYSYRYADGTVGLRDINFGLFTGETVALLGENGAGKSTLALCLLGLHLGEGSLLLDGEQVSPNERSRLWQRVGMVFQHCAEQLFCPSCWEEVAFGPQQLGLPADEVEHRTQEALALVQLHGCEERVPLNMSEGERKRLAIAAALSLRPDLLLLDEPAAGLDPRSEALLVQILAELPVTKLLITHDLDFIRWLSRRTVVLHQGRIIRDYATSSFLADEHLQEITGLDYQYKRRCRQA